MFRFRQFSIEDDRSTMKVGTDAVLLGAWADASQAHDILEIGTGCGVVALMLAQRSGAQITAIDNDPDSVGQATANFLASPWKERLHAQLADIRCFARSDKKYHLIISNPPFFSQSLRSPSERRNKAKHAVGLSLVELLTYSNRLLASQGAISLILPFSHEEDLRCTFNQGGLYISRLSTIIPVKGKKPNRILVEGRKTWLPIQRDMLIVRVNPTTFSKDYVTLTKDYYL